MVLLSLDFVFLIKGTIFVYAILFNNGNIIIVISAASGRVSDLESS